MKSFLWVSDGFTGIIKLNMNWSMGYKSGIFFPLFIDEKYHPPVWILFDLDSISYFKQNGQALWRCLFIWACEGLSIRKTLHINVWEMAWVTAMAAGGEQTRSAHARDVSLGARIDLELVINSDLIQKKA